MRRLGWVLVASLSACAPVYITPAFNAPLLRRQGEISGAIHAGTSGIDVQGAYAILDHIGVLADFSAYQGEAAQAHAYTDVGGGVFLPFGADIGRFEVCAGVGYGRSSGAGKEPFSGRTINASGAYWRGFAQAALGMGSDIVDAAFVSRMAYVRYQYNDMPETNGEPGVHTELFLEPAVLVRLGYRLLKAELQMGFDMPTTGAPGPVTQLFHMTLGLRGQWGGFE